ncbi:MAG: NAD(P)/FAD-dependent oxidoreductase [Alphaproteobacteria bacterium]|nr:NAD(P)/FAD-dependent oxidoreductase [Alphaproteobacteria bacterium]
MSKTYDVIVLGTGNAGMAAAGAAREAGLSVAMVESRDVGGTCPIRGCVPKKVLVAAAQVLHQIDTAAEHHISVDAPKLDWSKLIERERSFVDGVPEAFTESLESRGIDLYEGRARFVGPRRVQVGDATLDGGKIVIATGSTPRPLAIPGAEHLITSEHILELASLPESLIFIGGGVIALEFAHVLARAGTKITILEALPRLLPRNDADAVAQLQKESERIGIDVLTGVNVREIVQDGNRLAVRFEHDGAEKTLSATLVANGTGRIPDFDGLDLDAAEIEHDGTRIAVDDTLRSVSNPDVYVGGDALWSSPQLSPVASHEGKVIGRNLVNGGTATPDYLGIPANVYAVPALASVGLTEAEAEAQDLEYTVKVADMADWRSAKTHAETVAYSKVLVEEDTGRILGAHLVGHGAEEIIHLFAFAMKHGVTAKAMAETVYAYPTFASDIKFMV